MGSINLYKIDSEKIQSFSQDLQRNMAKVKVLNKTKRTHDNTERSFTLTLYLARPDGQKELSWNWVLEEFQEPSAQISQTPKGIILKLRTPKKPNFLADFAK